MIGKALKYMRLQKRIKQEDMAKLLNIGQSTLSDYENEKISINYDTIEKIAKKCDYTIIFKNNLTNEKWQVKDLKRKDV